MRALQPHFGSALSVAWAALFAALCVGFFVQLGTSQLSVLRQREESCSHVARDVCAQRIPGFRPQCETYEAECARNPTLWALSHAINTMLGVDWPEARTYIKMALLVGTTLAPVALVIVCAIRLTRRKKRTFTDPFSASLPVSMCGSFPADGSGDTKVL